ncbi:MAG TPA: M50 family metallopeptidase [Acidobacteriaceae bacterium]|nr:M50 family metallopeptidase [Acidobacteriaceae bacterium]
MFFSFLQALILDCALIVLALTAHELGHALVARMFDVPVKEFGLSWTGPYVRRARATGWREVVICLAGATVNLILAAALWKIDHWFALFNLTVGVVNLLPITHSDGSHALDALNVIEAPVTTSDEDEQSKAA